MKDEKENKIPYKRVDSAKITNKEKMDKVFNSKIFAIIALELDF